MRLYKISSPSHIIFGKEEPDLEIAAKISWQGNQADARKKRIEFEEPFKEIKAMKRPKVVVEEVDIPTNKDGLLAFLNENCK